MKRYVLGLLVTLFCSCLCFGAGPHIPYTAADAAIPAALQQPMELWIEADGPWYLFAECVEGLTFCDHDGQIVQNGQIAKGVGSEQSSHVLEVYFDVAFLAVGSHRLDMQVILEGAQGVLGLRLATGRWILPLNSDQVKVEKEGTELLALPSGEWFLLEATDRVFYGNKEMTKPVTEVTSARAKLGEAQTKLWWDSALSHFDLGEWASVKLIVSGPSQGGELLLRSHGNLHLGCTWLLAGQLLECAKGAEDSVILSMPALGPGIYELSGFVQALLPLPAGQGEISAFWQDRSAQLALEIDRSWFDHEGTQTVHVNTTSPLALPGGRIHLSQGYSEVTVQAGGLDAIVPLDNPAEPIWTGLPLLESIVWAPQAPAGGETGPKDFVLPVFLWDDGLSWRLVASSGPWFLDASADRQRFTVQGRFGSISADLTAAEQRATISSTWPVPQGAGGWHWRQTATVRRGTYNQGKWFWTITIPREPDQLPSASAQYRAEKFGIRLTREDLSLRFSSERWSWGARLNPRILWLESSKPRMRLQLGEGKATLDYRPDDHREVKLNWDKKGLQLDFLADPWQAYLSVGPDGPGAGLRYKQASSQGRWLSVTKATMQLNNNLLLTEAQGQLGYVLGPICTVYVEGIINASLHWQEGYSQTNFRYGGGLILRPSPQVVTALGWDSERHWHVKIGLALPFVGRKSSLEFE